MKYHLPTLTKDTRRVYTQELMPSLRRVTRPSATLDTDYEHPAQLGSKIAEKLIRAGLTRRMVSLDRLVVEYYDHGGTIRDPRGQMRSYVKDIRDALASNPNTNVRVYGSSKTGWCIR